MTCVSFHRIGPTLGTCESILIFITVAHPSVNLDMSFIIFEAQTAQRGLYPNKKGMCIFFLKSIRLLFWLGRRLPETFAFDDNLKGVNTGETG